MNIDAVLYGLGSATLFTSRAFVPAFLTALCLRFGDQLPLLSRIDLLQHAGSHPAWLTHGLTISVLGVLAVLEVLSDKIPEAQEALDAVNRYLKPAAAVLTYLGVLGATDRSFVENALTQQAGVVDGSLAVLIGGATFLMVSVRTQFYDLLFEADEDDDLGLRSALSWFEDLWAVLGVFLLFVYPVVMLALFGTTLAVLKLLSKYLARREDRARMACRNCGALVYPCAVACQKCGTPLEAPRDIGLFGQAKARPAPDPETQPFRLAQKKRCPVCATRLKQREVRQTCPECGHRLFADGGFADIYVARVTARLPVVLGVSTLLSLIPVLGLIPGMIYYRFTLVGPFRRYLPLGSRFCLKWVIRLLFFILIAVQWIPAVGGVVVPLMAGVSYLVYRAAFTKRLQEIRT